MDGVVFGIFYASILFCVIGSVVMLVRQAGAPLHLRGELYHGSSIYERSDWWTKTQLSLKDKLKSVAKDVFFLEGYYRRNMGYRYFLYLFHVGLYLLVLWHVWLFVGAAVGQTGALWGLIWGDVATILTFIGSAGILIKRMTEKNLKVDYPAIHYFKWLFVLLTLGGGFYAVHFFFNLNMSALMEYVRMQLSFSDLGHKLRPPLATALHLLFVAPWLLLLPFSHVMLLFFRYYHQLRWDHVPNSRGSNIERRVKKLLNQPLAWSASHIQSGERWSEVVEGLPEAKTGTERR